MGVKDLWQLLAPIGRRVSVESLEGKTLAIDASIWITQFIKAMRDEEGKMIKNAHLIGTLRRILRLLFHKIRPLFVFDGVTPELKVRTVQSRRRGRELQEESKRVAAQRLLRSQLRQRAVEISSSSGHRTENGSSFASSFRLGGRQNPPAENGATSSKSAPKESGVVLDVAENDADVQWVDGYEQLTAKELNEEDNDSDGQDEWQLPTDADELNPDVLGALPPHIRKSLIEEARRKQRNVSRSNYLPVAGNPALYSQTQLSNFLSSSKLNRKFVEAQQRLEGSAQGIRIAADGGRKYQLLSAMSAARRDTAPAERWSEHGSRDSSRAQCVDDDDLYSYWEPEPTALRSSASTATKQIIDHIDTVPRNDGISAKETPRRLLGDGDTAERPEPPEPTLSAGDAVLGPVEPVTAESNGDATPRQTIERSGTFILRDSGTDESGGESGAEGTEEARGDEEDDVLWESGTDSCPSDKPEDDTTPAGSSEFFRFQPDASGTDQDAAVGGQDSRHRADVGPISSEAIERAVHTAASMADWAGRAVRQALKGKGKGLHLSPASPAPAPSAALSQAKRRVSRSPPTNSSNLTGSAKNADQIPGTGPCPVDAVPDSDFNPADTVLDWGVSAGDAEGFDAQSARRRTNRAMRDTASLTEELKDEVIQLLQTMNLPYIVAPFEAEAQCAVLEQLGLVDGVVTEDSDALLFGAATVYKNIFTDKKFVEVYLAEDAKREMGLWREDLVALAYFLGSDYTEGVNGVGIVNAAEIIHAFPMHGHTVREEEAQLRRGGGIGGSAEDIADGPLRGLRRFKDWLHGYNFEGELFGNASGARDTHSTGDTGNAQDRMVEFTERHRSGRAKWTVPESFPDPRIARAYLKPAASYNPEPFDWRQHVDAVALKAFCSDKLGWTDQQIRATVEPVLQRYAERSTQTRIDSHFMTYHNDMRFAKISSERLKGAVTQITGKRTSVSLGGSATQSGSKAKRSKDRGAEKSLL